MAELQFQRTGPRAFIVGWPVAHSRSPLIHGYWLKQFDLAGSYERVAVAPADIGTFLAEMPASGFVGGNVTVPHKEAAFAAASRRDAVATLLGAANTLWMEGGQLCAGNTDAIGFLANLDASAPGWDAADGRAVVLGAGGAARSVVWALLSRGLDVAVVNRTVSRAEELVARFGGGRAYDWDALPGLLGDAGLLVNTTSLGMHGHAAAPVDLAPLPGEAFVSDIVYVPLETPLIAAARAGGYRTVDGLGMLLHQAVPGFERWFGVRPQVTAELRALVEADVRAGQG
ncbi:MAG: shikimate dehydrogenase [Ancalomicrobiaceae bacterium]|nr:shikimate dehydrogenase [Ancalomicrobiaceae bacterium]